MTEEAREVVSKTKIALSQATLMSFPKTDARFALMMANALKAFSDKYNLREISQLEEIAQFTFNIRYTKWCDNSIDDALSRATVNSITSVSGVDMQRMANEEEQSDYESWSHRELPLGS